jgi:GAF domain-containing protein
MAAAARASGIGSAAGAPIVVDGRVWGLIATTSWEGEALPDRIEDRLAEFTALIAPAFSNTASRDEVARLADEQAALRRVATLVARQPRRRRSSERWPRRSRRSWAQTAWGFFVSNVTGRRP